MSRIGHAGSTLWWAALCVLLFACLSTAATAQPGETGTKAGGLLHLGVFPRRPVATTRRMFQPLVNHLSNQLGRPVALHTPPDYLSFWRAVERGRYDLVHYNQYHYVRAHRQFGHRVLARNEENGDTRIRTTILVRDDSPVHSLDQLRGRKILFGGSSDAMVSYVLATDLLRKAGLKAGNYMERFANNPPKAVVAMFYAQADAAAAGEPVLNEPQVRALAEDTGLRSLAQSMPIPQLPWATGSRVDAATRTRLEDILLGLHESPLGKRILQGMRMNALRPVEDADYDIVRTIVVRVLGESY